MKKSIILFVALLLAFGQTAMAQRTLNEFPQMKPANFEKTIRAEGLSTNSAFLLADLIYGKLSERQLVGKYGLVYSNGQPTVTAFVEGASEALANYGAKIVSRNGEIARVNIPLSQFAALAQSGVCSRIDIGAMGQLSLQEARAEMGIDNIYNGIDLPQGYDGTGVVVGIIDIGFEYCHPAFYDSTGTIHRVKRVWEQNATSGTAPAGFDYGREMTTTEEMMAAQCSHLNQSHASHVTGIAAGCGGNTDSARRFRGMAPGADIVMVSTTMGTANIFDGIHYISDYAASVGKPCVINMSINSQNGPHDGTSSFDRSCDAFISEHPQGVILVGSAGNDGHLPIHISKQFSAQDTMLYTFINISGGMGFVYLWGAPNVPFKAGLALIDTANYNVVETGSFYHSADEMETYDSLSNGDITFYAASSVSPFNQRHEMSFIFNHYTNSPYRLCLVVQCDTVATVHGWAYRASFVNDGFSVVQAGDNEYSVGEISGTGHHIVTVGAYTTKTEWVDINGNPHHLLVGSNGALAFFSSHGPTLDGRTKPDITAPGQLITAPFNSYDNAQVSSIFCETSTQFNGGDHYYGIMQGTSMSAPMVTGIIALWLQAHPEYNYDSVITHIRSTARTDTLTGAIPATGSNLWGWGKINPYGALPYYHNGVETFEVVDYKLAVDDRRIIIDAPEGESILIVDVLGRVLVAQREVTHAAYTMPAAGIYIVRVGKASARKVVVR